MARFNPNFFHEETPEESLKFGNCCKIVLQAMPYTKYPGRIASYVIDCVQQSDMESMFGPEDTFVSFLWSFLENTPVNSYPEVFFEKRLLDEAACFSIPMEALPAYLQEFACEQMMDYYLPGDSGDDGEELRHHAAKYFHEEEIFFSAAEEAWFGGFWKITEHDARFFPKTASRLCRAANRKHPTAHHSTCRNNEWYGNYSKKTIKELTSKRLRKEIDIPNGKSGYKKMKDSEFIF